MGSTGVPGITAVQNLQGKSSKEIIAEALAGYDERFARDLETATDYYATRYPDVRGIRFLNIESRPGEVAAMGRFGNLTIDSRVIQNYDYVARRLRDGYLAGGNTFDSVATHELAHNLDLGLSMLLSEKRPDADGTSFTITNDLQARVYSEALGKQLKIGDSVTTPGGAYDKPYIKVGNKSYTATDLFNNDISGLVVPQALENVRTNWKALGYQRQPSESELVRDLSGYSREAWTSGDAELYANRHKEVFAEAMSAHAHRGLSAQPLAQEIVRLTDDLYRQYRRRKVSKGVAFEHKLGQILAKQK